MEQVLEELKTGAVANSNAKRRGKKGESLPYNKRISSGGINFYCSRWTVHKDRVLFFIIVLRYFNQFQDIVCIFNMST